ncbi:PP2C family protein-serine/threonine phosphatase [Neisseria cinerea]|jgi:putative stage II sporulation protein E|uniref:PP2C family protein-serine/threonine phosphatase n=1 Tax=Neisseria cinerea TaxID=483 RepID=UPI000D2FD4AF|nr:protein phosphatase 2C domain-containing protein [Neisseria cinerea]
MFQIAYFQMAGAGKTRNQDALFDGTAVRQVKLHKTRLSEVAGTVRLAVADGVFSSPAPHVASRFWMEAFAREGDAEGRFLRNLHDSFCDMLADRYFGSASTFASAIVEANGLCRICNVGDSRIYHISAHGRWRQLSHDHTVLADLIEQGEAQPDMEYAGIYYALAHCLVADYEEKHFKIFTNSLTLQKGEAVLVCSDGLHDALVHNRLEELWNAYHSLSDKLEALRRAVKRFPFHDDCSVAICLI